MAHAISSRLERLCAIISAAFWLLGLVLHWVLVQPEPSSIATALLGSYLLAWGALIVLAPPPRSRVIARFTAMTLALGLSLGCLELLSMTGLTDFRSLFATTVLDPRLSSDNVSDPKLIHIHKPYLKRVGATHGDIASSLHLTGAPLHRFAVSYDHNGFRNPRDLTSADLVVLGDSFVEGGLVADENLLTTSLGVLLSCTVANLGQSAYGPQQELAVLKRYAVPMRPRLCVWMFYEGNDLEDVARYEQLTGGGPRRAGRTTLRERSFVHNALLRFSSTLNGILATDLSDQAPCGTFAGSDGQKPTLFFQERGASRSRRDLPALSQVLSVLTAAHETCKANRMRLLVVFIPRKFRVYKDYCTYPPANPSARWTIDDLPERLREGVHSIDPNLDFLDLTPAFKTEAARGQLLYFGDDTHWSAEGHQLAGKVIAEEVKRQGDLQVPSSSTPQRDDQVATVTRTQ